MFHHAQTSPSAEVELSGWLFTDSWSAWQTTVVVLRFCGGGLTSIENVIGCVRSCTPMIVPSGSLIWMSVMSLTVCERKARTLRALCAQQEAGTHGSRAAAAVLARVLHNIDIDRTLQQQVSSQRVKRSTTHRAAVGLRECFRRQADSQVRDLHAGRRADAAALSVTSQILRDDRRPVLASHRAVQRCIQHAANQRSTQTVVQQRDRTLEQLTRRRSIASSRQRRADSTTSAPPAG